MHNFTYIIGANILLFCTAKVIAADPETNTPQEMEVLTVKLANGADVETMGISIDGEHLDTLLEIQAAESLYFEENIEYLAQTKGTYSD